VFAADRIDTWIFYVGIAVPLVCLAGLGLWQLSAFIARKLRGERRAVRESPEPPRPLNEDPERLERTCAALTESLAAAYLQLADSWQRRGQTQQATAALKKLVQMCPDTPQARIARERLEQFATRQGD
jgi:hypothetical protein